MRGSDRRGNKPPLRAEKILALLGIIMLIVALIAVVILELHHESVGVEGMMDGLWDVIVSALT